MKRRVALIASLAVVVAVSGGWLYSRNTLFRLSEVEVLSENQDLQNHLRAELVDYLGRSLFSISLGEIEGRVLELPAIEHVSLHRSWPTKIVIEVQERSPLAMTFIDGQLWSVDHSGHLIEALRQAQGLPLLKGFFQSVEEKRLGQSRHAEAFAWLDALGRDEGLAIDAGKITEVVWADARGLLVKCFEMGFDVELGTANFLSAWRRAAEAYALLKSRNVNAELLDATYRSRVVVRIRSKLQISQNGLNLEELVRRRGPSLNSQSGVSGAAAR